MFLDLTLSQRIDKYVHVKALTLKWTFFKISPRLDNRSWGSSGLTEA